MTTKKLTLRQKILVAGTLFGMFFGAGNLIFPVHLGQMAGQNALPAIIGFIITAVGIPILGVAAIGVTHSDGLQTLSGKVGKGYGIFFTCLLYLTIGPLFAIPRCATVSFTTGITPLLGADSPERLYLLLFPAILFSSRQINQPGFLIQELMKRQQLKLTKLMEQKILSFRTFMQIILQIFQRLITQIYMFLKTQKSTQKMELLLVEI